MKKINYKKIGWLFLITLVLISINASAIIWLVANIIPCEFELKNTGIIISDGTLWDAWSLGEVYANYIPEHSIVYVFMFIGFALTFFFIKWLLQEQILSKRHKEEMSLKKKELSLKEKEIDSLIK